MQTKQFARRLGLLIGCCVAAVVESHDFWVQPDQYWPNPDALTPLTLQVGHGPFRQRSLRRNRPKRRCNGSTQQSSLGR